MLGSQLEDRKSEGINLYVSNLSYSTDEHDLESAFQPYGKTIKIMIIKDINTRRSRGFGFVSFENLSDAENAIKNLDRSQINGREIRVERARESKNQARPKYPRNDTGLQRSNKDDFKEQGHQGRRSPAREERKPEGVNLYVSSLSYSTDENDLESVFQSYGKIVSIKIIKDINTRRSRGFGFVTFENLSDAENAISNLDRSQINGREIRVEKARESKNQPKPKYPRNNDRNPQGFNRERGYPARKNPQSDSRSPTF